MKKILPGLLVLPALLLCALCLSPKTAPETEAASPPAETAAAPTPTPAPTPLRASITVAGDLVLHTSIVNQCRTADGGYDFTPLFEDVSHYVSDADLALCCFEGAFVKSNYQGYPLFLVPDGLAASLRTVGFDLVATASNHAMDGGKAGVARTLDVLDKAGLDHVGTCRTQAERDADHGVVVEDVNGIRIAFLDYTYGTNGIPTTNAPYAVNLLYTDYMTSFSKVDYGLLDADLAYAKSLKPDLIAVIAHWGTEYIPAKQPAQEALAKYWFSHGVDLVLGGHPHVPEPMETVTVTDENGNEKTGFICYCLGNLLANMKETDHKYCTLTAMVQLEIAKDTVTGKTTLEKASYVPMAFIDTQDLGITGAGWRFRVWDLNAAIADYEAGDDRGGILTEKLYNTLKGYRADLEQVCGTKLEADS